MASPLSFFTSRADRGRSGNGMGVCEVQGVKDLQKEICSGHRRDTRASIEGRRGGPAGENEHCPLRHSPQDRGDIKGYKDRTQLTTGP